MKTTRSIISRMKKEQFEIFKDMIDKINNFNTDTNFFHTAIQLYNNQPLIYTVDDTTLKNLPKIDIDSTIIFFSSNEHSFEIGHTRFIFNILYILYIQSPNMLQIITKSAPILFLKHISQIYYYSRDCYFKYVECIINEISDDILCQNIKIDVHSVRLLLAQLMRINDIKLFENILNIYAKDLADYINIAHGSSKKILTSTLPELVYNLSLIPYSTYFHFMECMISSLYMNGLNSIYAYDLLPRDINNFSYVEFIDFCNKNNVQLVFNIQWIRYLCRIANYEPMFYNTLILCIDTMINYMKNDFDIRILFNTCDESLRNKIFYHYVKNYGTDLFSDYVNDYLDSGHIRWYIDKLNEINIPIIYENILYGLNIYYYNKLVEHIDENNLGINICNVPKKLRNTPTSYDYYDIYGFYYRMINKNTDVEINLDRLIELHNEQKVIINIDKLINYILCIEPINVIEYLYNNYCGMLFNPDEFILINNKFMADIPILENVLSLFDNDNVNDCDTDCSEEYIPDTDINTDHYHIRYYTQKVNWFKKNSLQISNYCAVRK